MPQFTDYNLQYYLDNSWGIFTGAKFEEQRNKLAKLMTEGADFDLCDHVALMIDDNSSIFQNHKMHRKTHWVVKAVWGAAGIIGNGGFEYLFSGEYEGDPFLAKTREAFGILGCRNAVRAFDRAFEVFKDNRPPRDPKRRSEIFGRLPARKREAINRQFWKTEWSKELEKTLAAYIRANADAFQTR